MLYVGGLLLLPLSSPQPTESSENIPASALAQTTPPVALFSPDYQLFESWRPQLNASYAISGSWRLGVNGTYTLNRMYENYAVPAPSDANGHKQQQIPEKFGIINFLTQATNSTAPAVGPQNHFLPRLGNTIRFMSLVGRSSGTRATFETNAPTRIQFNLCDTPIFVETPAYRRTLMWERYGFESGNRKCANWAKGSRRSSCAGTTSGSFP